MVIRIATIVPIKDETPETVRACAEALRVAENYLKFARKNSDNEYVVKTYFVIEVSETTGPKTYESLFSALSSQVVPVITRDKTNNGNVGLARNVGLLHAVEEHPEEVPPDFVFTTDSDSQVDPVWYAAHLDVLESRINGDLPSVSHGGVILPKGSGRAAAWLQYLRSDNAGNDVFEQNMAFNGRTLHLCGGFARLTHGEGRATINRVRRMGPEVRHNTTVVTTSDRTIGKVPHGFADLLSRL